jgi:hypothetical protein
MNQLAIVLLISFSGKALLAQDVYPDLNKSLETVIRSFPAALADVKGELIQSRGQTSEYRSKLTITGASAATITEQQMIGRKILSWKTVLYSGTDIEDIKIKYSEVFKQLNNSIIKSGSDKPFILSGKFREPFLAKTAVSHFALLPSTGELKDIKVDLILDRNGKMFLVYLNVYSN